MPFLNTAGSKNSLTAQKPRECQVKQVLQDKGCSFSSAICSSGVNHFIPSSEDRKQESGIVLTTIASVLQEGKRGKPVHSSSTISDKQSLSEFCTTPDHHQAFHKEH